VDWVLDIEIMPDHDTLELMPGASDTSWTVRLKDQAEMQLKVRATNRADGETLGATMVGLPAPWTMDGASTCHQGLMLWSMVEQILRKKETQVGQSACPNCQGARPGFQKRCPWCKHVRGSTREDTTADGSTGIVPEAPAQPRKPGKFVRPNQYADRVVTDLRLLLEAKQARDQNMAFALLLTG
jgi:hypothetical protein